MIRFLPFLAGAALFSWVLTGLVRQWALRTEMMDVPGPRSSHQQPTPRGGGLAVVFTFLAGSFLLNKLGAIPAYALHAVLWGGGLVAVVGLLDDSRGLPALPRLVAHLAAAAMALWLISPLPWPLPGWLVAIALIFGLGWGINLYNFMDGIDSLAASEAIFISTGAALLLWLNGVGGVATLWPLLLAACATGFLLWNLPPAKIFMGDTCSGFLGFVLGVFALFFARQGSISLWSWLILGALFLTDATVTLLGRLLRRERLHVAHRTHLYQVLARQFGSHTKVVLLATLVNVLWLLPLAMFASLRPVLAPACALVAVLPLTWLVIRLGWRPAA